MHPRVETRPQAQRDEDGSDVDYVVRVFTEFMDVQAERDGNYHDGPPMTHLHEMMSHAIDQEAIVRRYRDSELLGNAIRLLTILLNHEFRDEDKRPPWMKCPEGTIMKSYGGYNTTPMPPRGSVSETDHGNHSSGILVLAMMDP